MDGISHSNRVNTLNTRYLSPKLVSTVGNAPTHYARKMSMGERFKPGLSHDIVVQIADHDNGVKYVSGLEPLTYHLEDVNLTLSYSFNVAVKTITSSLVEGFANEGGQNRLSLLGTTYEQTELDIIKTLATDFYKTNADLKFNGLSNIIASTGTIGGVDRGIYTVLASKLQDAGGSGGLTHRKMCDFDDTIGSEQTGFGSTMYWASTTGWTIYEQILDSKVKHEYSQQDMRMPVDGDTVRPAASLKGASGIEAISFRSKKLLKDKYASHASLPGNFLYGAKEDSIKWYGKTEVPEGFDSYKKVDLSQFSTVEGEVASAAKNFDKFYGFFEEKQMSMTDALGSGGKFVIAGNFIMNGEGRYNGLLYNFS